MGRTQYFLPIKLFTCCHQITSHLLFNKRNGSSSVSLPISNILFCSFFRSFSKQRYSKCEDYASISVACVIQRSPIIIFYSYFITSQDQISLVSYSMCPRVHTVFSPLYTYFLLRMTVIQDSLPIRQGLCVFASHRRTTFHLLNGFSLSP